MKFRRFPSIEQFRSVVKQVRETTSYVGKDENGKPVYDLTKTYPTITFLGTVKLHGTNAAICYNKKDGLWCQSRERILTVEKDNAGFAFFVESNKEKFTQLFENYMHCEEVRDGASLYLYGEWAGQGIQKGVGISEVEKSFYPFEFIIVHENGETVEDLAVNCFLYDEDYLISEYDLTNVHDIEGFETYTISIDFNHPEFSVEKLTEITNNVENECPVAKYFGVSGIGEGVVWSTLWNNQTLRFKVKGEKHSSSKVKTLASVDVDKITNALAFADYVVTESRFNQALENVFINESVDIKKLGDVIKWVVGDVLKEELDTLSANGLEPKDVGKYVSTNVREMFLKLV